MPYFILVLVESCLQAFFHFVRLPLRVIPEDAFKVASGEPDGIFRRQAGKAVYLLLRIEAVAAVDEHFILAFSILAFTDKDLGGKMLLR